MKDPKWRRVDATFYRSTLLSVDAWKKGADELLAVAGLLEPQIHQVKLLNLVHSSTRSTSSSRESVSCSVFRICMASLDFPHQLSYFARFHNEPIVFAPLPHDPCQCRRPEYSTSGWSKNTGLIAQERKARHSCRACR